MHMEREQGSMLGILAQRTRLAVLAGLIVSLGACGIVGGGKDKRPKTPVFGNRVSILSSESGADVDPTLASVPVILPDPAAISEWSQPGGNAAKLIGHVALAASPSEIWSASISGSTNRARLAAAPVVAGGKLYVIDADARILAFDAKTGARLWQTQMPSEGNGRSLFGGGVSALGDKIFATTGVGDVAAINAANGTILWKKQPGGPLRGSPHNCQRPCLCHEPGQPDLRARSVDRRTQWNDRAPCNRPACSALPRPLPHRAR
jgi:outer membrane protein assembly factor BamB